MAENTAIEWCDHTFNPWIGCTKVSPGCDNCYAARQDGFRKWTPEGWGGPRKRTKTWGDPKKWNEQAEQLAYVGMLDHRPRVFCASLADVFDNDVPDPWRWDLFRLIAATPHLDWLLLTKRIGNARAMLNSAAAAVAGEFVGALEWDRAPWPNVWLGATVVNQPEYDRDIGKLLRTPAAVHFLSIEPMLGAIDMRLGGASMPDYADHRPLAPLSWVIAGGESGPGARPAHPDWFRSLRDQCAAAGVPFLFKQWGEWGPTLLDEGTRLSSRIDLRVPLNLKDTAMTRVAVAALSNGEVVEQWWPVARVGKAAAGRVLDGMTHDGFPT